ncbi:hypothetical protein H6798_03535 [Candidatus Nomurabacteria bacterium]|nr:hypothetical protein [Candidatus Nomurabacteria bacterium]
MLWPANDTYVITTPEGLNFDDGFASVGFDDNWYGIPASLRHPAYADALTLEELTQLPPGTIICRRTGNNPEHATEHVFFEASLVVYEYDGSLYPRWTDSQGMASSLSSWSLEDDGVIPYSNYTDTEWYGGWSGTRLTLGRCNAV